MIDLSHRSTEIELMDLPQISPEDYARALADLAKVNRITLTHRPILKWLEQATDSWPAGHRFSLLDVASGHGDLLRAIHVWGTKRGFKLDLRGIDLNPRSALEAAAATPPGMVITWQTGDVFAHTPDPAPDFIITSQFTHHLDDTQVVALLRWMERTGRPGYPATPKALRPWRSPRPCSSAPCWTIAR